MINQENKGQKSLFILRLLWDRSEPFLSKELFCASHMPYSTPHLKLKMACELSVFQLPCFIDFKTYFPHFYISEIGIYFTVGDI